MRTIESLKEKEVIVINSIEEYTKIVGLLNKAGKRWDTGDEYCAWSPMINSVLFKNFPIYINVERGRWGDNFLKKDYIYTQASEFFEKKLPKYWVVDISKDRVRGQETVIKYLNKVYKQGWVGDSYKLYGYSGRSSGFGTAVGFIIQDFINNPTLLTIDEFITYPEVRMVLELDKETKTNKVMKKYRLLTEAGYINGRVKKGNIYSEDYCINGYTVTEFVKTYPEDWELVEDVVKADARFPFKLGIKDAKRIIEIACSSWKNKLSKEWAEPLLMQEFVMISEAFYLEMRKACTEPQNKLFDEIFGKDKQPITYEDVMRSFNHVYYTNGNGSITKTTITKLNELLEPNNTYSEVIHQRQQAQLKLANVAKYLNKDKINKGYYIYLDEEEINYGGYDCSISEPVVFFKTEELAKQAVEILGEETVKLACQPLND